MTERAPTIVFDLDGTLADTAPDLVATLNTLLLRENLPPQRIETARPFVGAGARALLERGFAAAGAPLGEMRASELLAEFLEFYEAQIADETRLFPGAERSLDRFQEAGFRLAVCTNKTERLAQRLLKRLGVADRFGAICGRETFAHMKPDGRALLSTIGRVGGDPARAVMVGDSQTDVAAARNAGAPVVAVDFGYSDPPVATFRPDRLISHFDELWDAAAGLLR
ncbi:phosphoglycolate phosphatase [Methylocystis bryophila]|uniref:Phosphoglycolate phosphatase n=1 Tax=Methylocystis bryophila TaxID=655015 RepID=A0A1W6MVR2_9HYPH|nr:phosphoglycolate phosphatase [Methylocystis bryophila]ARN81691.1 phosphoglycolate phosphatase [Methylocystis bryophila]BDV37740.1 phosphoglycolate phosphatase, bacterial [Methylocystis bryophila]